MRVASLCWMDRRCLLANATWAIPSASRSLSCAAATLGVLGLESHVQLCRICFLAQWPNASVRLPTLGFSTSSKAATTDFLKEPTSAGNHLLSFFLGCDPREAPTGGDTTARTGRWSLTPKAESRVPLFVQSLMSFSLVKTKSRSRECWPALPVKVAIVSLECVQEAGTISCANAKALSRSPRESEESAPPGPQKPSSFLSWVFASAPQNK